MTKRNRRPPLGCRVRATAYYMRMGTDREAEQVRWELVSPVEWPVAGRRVVEGIYCGERYLTQMLMFGDVHYPQIRTCLVAIDHRRRVSVPPSDMEVLE